MKKGLLVWGIVLQVGFACSVKAQSIWNKTYVEDRLTMRFSSVVSSDTGYNIIGVTVNNLPPYYQQGLIVKIDTNGVLTKYNATPDTAGIDTGPFWNTLVKTHTGGFAFSGYGFDTSQHLVFGFIDTEFDSIRLVRYSIPNTYSFQARALLQYDNGYYVTGVHNTRPGFDSNVMLAKIDSTGNLLWTKYYDQYKMEFATSLIRLNNGNLMIGAFRNDINHPNEHANTWILEVDTEGTVVRQWFDTNDSTYQAEGLLQTKDGGFIYGAMKKFIEVGGLVATTATIIKMDNRFVKQWTFKEGYRSIYTGITDIVELSDGNFIACGQKPIYDNDTNILSGWIVKLDTRGNIVWNRVYTGINATRTLNYLNDIDVLPDGKLIAVGLCENDNQQPSQIGWFLKLDSNGCEIENCLVGMVEVERNELEFRIAPNPASNTVTISIEEDMIGSTATVSDVMGRRISITNMEHRISNMETGNLANGVYFVAVSNKEGRSATKKLVVSR